MHDKWKESDLRMRSMLEDAEVKAPRRVWRAVSDRLEGAASRTAAGAWWAWGAAFAAAALAAALVIPSYFRNAEQQNPISLVDMGTVPVAEIFEDSVDEAPSCDPVAAVPQYRKPVPVTALMTGEAAVAEVSDEPAETADPEPAVQSGKSQPAGDSYDYDKSRRYWASISDNDADGVSAAISRRRASIYAGGFVSTNDSGFASNRGRSLMSPAYGPAQSVDGLTETSASTYGIPFTVGLGVRIPVFNRVSVGAGLSYSLLERKFTGDYVKAGSAVSGDVAHRMQYVGIPVNIFYDIIEGYSAKSPVRFYAYGGGQVEKCISNRYIIRQAGQTVSGRTDGLQWSVAAGLGVEFKLAGPVSLYVDPSVRYYFYNGQPKSLRTEKPFMASFEAGFRFNL